MDEESNEWKPFFHSRVIVFVFTFFLGAFFGSLLFCQNLKEAGKKNFSAGTIISALLYNFFAFRLLTNFGVDNTSIRLFGSNSVATLIMAGPYWNYHFKNIKNYKVRSIWGPLIAIAVIYGFFIIMNIILPGRLGH